MRDGALFAGLALSAAVMTSAVLFASGLGRGAGDGFAMGDPGSPERGVVRYGRDVRPILSDRCFLCHGTDPGTREAGLRLDTFEGATADRPDGAAIVPGSPGRSEAWRRIISEDPDEAMPPASSHKSRLSASEREIVRRWIEQGAAYEAHWAFVAPERPALPPARGPGEAGTNPIDRFIDARLADAGLTPSAPASPAKQLRRLFLDITGLPPTPEEMSAFLSDGSPGAYERWVDRLLGEEPYVTRYAERMASWWLDQARYADTIGIHTDNGQSLWPYRDWVLGAFRDNTPYDRFIERQLAGDLLPDATDEDRVATGFLRAHVITDEGGAIPEEYLVEYAVDRVSTTGTVFMGLTLGCARCHDHKYDPVTMDDFYGLTAFFNSVDEPGLYSQTQDPNRAYEPFMPVPSPAQREQLVKLRAAMDEVRAAMRETTPEEAEGFKAFSTSLGATFGLAWSTPGVLSASSAGGATLTPQPDGSVLASGVNPDRDEHVFLLRAGAGAHRLIAVEALTDPSLPGGRVGRSPNGNAVLTGVRVEAAPADRPGDFVAVPLAWAWADIEQGDGDYHVVNALRGDARGWAVDAHRTPGPRVAMFLAGESFGGEGGAVLRVTLSYGSIYANHTLGRVRVSVSPAGEDFLSVLPAARARWHAAGPFPAPDRPGAFGHEAGPEARAFDPADRFGEKGWVFEPRMRDGEAITTPDGLNVHYLGTTVWSPSARELPVSLGSDDGFRLFVNGEEAASRDIERGIAPDQDRGTVRLKPGPNSVVVKIVNTGGQGGAYFKADPPGSVWGHDLTWAALPPGAIGDAGRPKVEAAWRTAYSPEYRAKAEQERDVSARLAGLEAAVPRTMVMKERPEPRETFVLSRGQYDHPDRARPVGRTTPRALPPMPEGVPSDRLGLARWLASPEHPLTARVAVNRVWELVFGQGLVRTGEDFGFQGEWPSHPELLDTLAVEFRESGWDLRALLRLIYTSRAYRRDAAPSDPGVLAADPENRLLARFPRQRLSAEQLRDQSLYVSGLLVERLGGPSVKPYQPEGLWPEVAMLQSNTRNYVTGTGEDLYRRSVYTYWKRASPPPAMLAFDAPTREFCATRRTPTNTPLQALAMWNDPAMVEASRKLAERTLAEPATGDRDRLARLVRRCAGEAPSPHALDALASALEGFRARYRAAPADADALLAVGASGVAEGADRVELASWAMAAAAVLAAERSIIKD